MEEKSNITCEIVAETVKEDIDSSHDDLKSSNVVDAKREDDGF